MESSIVKHPVKVMILEEHELFREGLKTVLRTIKRVELTGEAGNSATFLGMLEKKLPDIAFICLGSTARDGVRITAEILRKHPALRIIIVSEPGQEEFLVTLLQAGIRGCLLKSSRIHDLERAIDLVAGGEQYFSSEINGVLANRLREFSGSSMNSMSPREKEILRLICHGYTTQEIAKMVHLSQRTVEGHRQKLLKKTQQPNIVNLVLYALKNKLVSLEDLEPRTLTLG